MPETLEELAATEQLQFPACGSARARQGACTCQAPAFAAVCNGPRSMGGAVSSALIHFLLIAGLTAVGPRAAVEKLVAPRESLVWVAPSVPAQPPAPRRPAAVRVSTRRTPPPPAALTAPALRPEVRHVEKPPDLPAPEPVAPLPRLPLPAPPDRAPRTSVFANAVTPVSEPVPPVAALPPVKTGSFDRSPALSVPRQQASTRAGDFDAVAPPVPSAPGPGVVRGAGFADAAAAPRAATPGQSAPLRAGFDSMDASAPAPAPGHPVGRTAFDQVSTVAALPSGNLPVAPPLRRPVEILDKPKPNYTDEARRRRVEGTVQLEVLFSAAGTVQIRRIVRGLGFGLDEAACAAARQIRFRPATHNGKAVDQVAVLHIVFHITE